MKKLLLVVLLLIFVFYQRYDYIDLSTYQSDMIRVEIKGEVFHPDVYKMAYDSTLSELIEKAGGVKDSGDISALNQNQPLQHNDVIVIPTFNEKVQKVSINSASLEELTTLKGVGPSTAQKIIDYRNTNGSFQTLEEIMQIKGIKEKLFAKIKDYITL